MTFSPGPWMSSKTLIGSTHGDPNRREVYGFPLSEEPHRRTIPTRSICRLNEFMHEWTAEDEANLRLILKAPDMHGLLTRLISEPRLGAPMRELFDEAEALLRQIRGS